MRPGRAPPPPFKIMNDCQELGLIRKNEILIEVKKYTSKLGPGVESPASSGNHNKYMLSVLAKSFWSRTVRFFEMGVLYCRGGAGCRGLEKTAPQRPMQEAARFEYDAK